MATSNATSLSFKHPEPPLLCVPNELLHKIFTYLMPTEAANFRRLNKRIANIGVEYIVPTIFLALSEDSFDKLEAIARHPEIRKYVSSLFFDTTYVEAFDREHWEEAIYSLDMMLQRDAIPYTSLAERKAHFEALQTWDSRTHYKCTNDQLDGAFVEYQQYIQKQSQLLRAYGYLRRITEALEKYPSLNEIRLDSDARHAVVGLKPWVAFKSGLCIEKTIRKDDYPASEAEVHAILNSVHRAGLRLEKFTCSLLSYWYFSCSRDYAPYSGSLIHLKSLGLVIHSMKDTYGFIDCLYTGRVLRFLTLAPYLESLRLGVFYGCSRSWDKLWGLEHFVGSFHWTLLAHVTIGNVGASEDFLKGFLKRHSSTLQSVEIATLSLYDGKWMSMFRMMRSELRLHAVALHGYFMDDTGFFSIDTIQPVAEESFSRNVQDYILRVTEDTQAIEAYLDHHTSPRNP